MNRLKGHILRQVDEGKLSREEAFELLRELAEADLRAAAPAPEPLRDGPRVKGDVAIIGMACRVPRARSPHELWKNLAGGVDAVAPYPRARMMDVIRTRTRLWERYRGQVESAPPIHGGWLPDVDRFDPAVFGISRPDAVTIGPPERLFLLTAWEALQSAGLSRRALEGSRTGVYLAHSPEVPFEYTRLLPDDDPQATAFNNPGSTGYRLAYWLDLRGPTMVVNTTCSSSLVACHVARRELLAGSCDLAVVGGLSLFLFPFFHDTNDPMRLRAPDGRCKAFDASADGLSMGEGVVTLVLRPLDAAIEHGDPVLAVIKGSAVVSDGRSNGLTAPNPAAQTQTLIKAWEDAGIDPSTLSYVEAHGAGTQLGDPIEVKGLTDAFRQYTTRTGFCGLGSVKTNLSHLGDAAGIAGLLKVVLSLQHRALPPSLHFRRPNPLIPFEQSAMYVNATLKPWDAPVRRAGINSFGISGTNCHVVVEEPPAPRAPKSARPFVSAPEPRRHVLALSARSLGALWRLLADLEEMLAELPEDALPTVCAAALARDAHEYRAAIVADGVADLAQKVGRLGQLRHLERLPARLAAQGIHASRVAGAASERYSTLPEGGAPGGPEDLVRRFLTEERLDPEAFAPGERRAALPPAGYDLERFWPPHEVPETTRFDDYFFRPAWIESPRAPAAALRTDGPWLLLGNDGDAFTRALAGRLSQAGAAVVTVSAGDRFEVPEPDAYCVDPGSPAQLQRLVAHVKQRHSGPVRGVVHLWGCRPPDDAMDSLAALVRSQDLACLGLFRLVKVLLAAEPELEADVVAVTSCAQAVDGSEPALIPARVTTGGFVKVLSQEAPLISTAAVDVDLWASPPEALAEEVFAEIAAGRPRRDELIALRGGRRSVQAVERMPAAAELQASPPVREGGAYVLAGGAGYLGLQVAGYLARQAKVKVALLGRTRLPPRQEWPALRSARAGEVSDHLRYVMDGVERIEALGSEVLHLPVDVTDPVQVEAGLAKVRKAFGPIRGVVVAQKQLYHKPIRELTDDEFRAGIMNRVQGTWLLDQATREDPLDFLLLFSSISSLMGTKTASECCAVNQYLDAYPAAAAKRGRPASALNLTLVLDDLRDFRGPTPIPPLDFREFAGCLDHFLRAGPRMAVASRFDWEEVGYLLPVLKLRFSEELLASKGLTAPHVTAAPPPSVAPANGHAESRGSAAPELRAGVRELFRQILGEAPGSDEASFFSAGGTSLTGLKLVKAVRERWSIPFEAADLYADSTVAALANRLSALLKSPEAAALAPAIAPAPAKPAALPLDQLVDRVARGDLDVEAAIGSLTGGDPPS